MNLPSLITSNNVQPLYDHENYIEEAKFRLQNAHQAAKIFIDKLKHKNKKYNDRNSNPLKIKVGDAVYLRRKPYDKLNTLNEKYVIKSI